MRLPRFLARRRGTATARGGDEPTLTLVVLPHGPADLSRSYQWTYRRLRWVAGAGVLLLVALVAVLGSWWSLASQAARVPRLQRQVAGLERERQQMVDLERKLREVEAGYEQMRGMLGADRKRGADGLYLPPAGTRADSAAPRPASPTPRP